MYHYYARVDTTSGAFPETFPDYEPATLDINVRKAITHALDRHLLAEVHGSASARLARVCSYYPEGFGDKYADADVISDWYDPDLAKEYLAAAGYADGEGPTLLPRYACRWPWRQRQRSRRSRGRPARRRRLHG